MYIDVATVSLSNKVKGQINKPIQTALITFISANFFQKERDILICSVS